MEENWLALFISIVKGVSAEAAFSKLHKQSEKKETKKSLNNKYEIFNDEDIEKMIELKKSMSYKQVAKIFNTVDRNIYNHIKRYRPELIKSGVLGYNKGYHENSIFQDGFEH